VRHRILPEADEEFAEAVRHYSEIDPELGVRFYREMERLIRDVCISPERFFMFNPPVRRRLSTVFPYAVVYVEKPDGVWIVAVMHTGRKPGYWRSRLE
jgi:plasmid stabilization system protein ParE